MLHLLMGKEPWFAPKMFGYGAGFPIAWQGWALLASYAGLIAGVGLYARAEPTFGPAFAFAIIVPATIAFLLIVRKRTRGGWHWRWGSRD